MRIVILGAGLAGITSAWECLRDGHEVTVLDRAKAPADFTSRANAGLIAPGHAYAWASPSVPRIMLRSLWRNDQAIRYRLVGLSLQQNRIGQETLVVSSESSIHRDRPTHAVHPLL